MNSAFKLCLSYYYIISYILTPRKAIKYVFEYFQFRILASIQDRSKNDIRIRLRGVIHFNFKKGNQRKISNEMQR